MNEKIGDKDRTLKKPSQGAFSGRGMLALAGALVVILALVIGLNVGGVREQLLGGGTPRINSLAVLALENLSRDPEQDYFADGLTYSLNVNLQQMRVIRIAAHAAAMQYKKAPKPLPDLAGELAVDGVVTGSVLRTGDRVRFTANLVQAPTGRHLWGQTYERDLSDILNLLDEISRSIAYRIKAKLPPQQEARWKSSRRPVNPQAYDALLRARTGGAAKTEAYLKQAIQLDPGFAWPYNLLSAMIYGRNMFPTLAPRDTYPAAKEAAKNAVSLDPESPDNSQPYRILALVALEYDWDFVESEKDLKRAVELSPAGVNAHHYYAHYLLSMGRMEEAKVESQRAIEIMPKSSSLLACVSWHDIADGNYEEAEKRALEALKLGAPDQLARLTLGWSYALRGRHDEAIAEFQKAVVGWQGTVFPTAVLGHGYAIAGQEAAAREVLGKLLERSKTEYVSPYEIAVIYTGLGDEDRAFDWLEKAYEERATLLVYFRMDPRIWSLRSDARFQGLLDRMNFPKDRR